MLRWYVLAGCVGMLGHVYIAYSGACLWIIRGLHFHIIYCMNIFNEKERTLLLISHYYAILTGINDFPLNIVYLILLL